MLLLLGLGTISTTLQTNVSTINRFGIVLSINTSRKPKNKTKILFSLVKLFFSTGVLFFNLSLKSCLAFRRSPCTCCQRKFRTGSLSLWLKAQTCLVICSLFWEISLQKALADFACVSSDSVFIAGLKCLAASQVVHAAYQSLWDCYQFTPGEGFIIQLLRLGL